MKKTFLMLVAAFAAAVVVSCANAAVVPADSGYFVNVGAEPKFPVNKLPDTFTIGAGKALAVKNDIALIAEINHLAVGSLSTATYVDLMVASQLRSAWLAELLNYHPTEVDLFAKVGSGTAGKIGGVGVFVLPPVYSSNKTGVRFDIDVFERLGGSSTKTVTTISIIHVFE